MIASSVFFGAYGSLPDAVIWWCLRTGGVLFPQLMVLCLFIIFKVYYFVAAYLNDKETPSLKAVSQWAPQAPGTTCVPEPCRIGWFDWLSYFIVNILPCTLNELFLFLPLKVKSINSLNATMAVRHHAYHRWALRYLLNLISMRLAEKPAVLISLQL